MRLQSGTNGKLAFVAVDATDLKTRETGLSGFTVYRSRDGGTATAYTTPTVTELSSANMPGVYILTIDEDTTLTAGVDEEEYVVHITQASMAPVTRAFEIFRPKMTAGNTAAVDAGGSVDANVDEWLGSTPTSLDGSGNVVASLAADAISASKIADDAFSFEHFAPQSGPYIRKAFCQTGSTSTTLVLDAIAVSANDFYNGNLVSIIDGVCEGETRLITDYDGASRTATIEPAWVSGPPSDLSVFMITPNGNPTADAANKVADHTWRRTLANIAASAFGDTIIERSPINALRKLVNRVKHTPGAPGTLDTYAEDDSTVAMSQAATTTGGTNPITELDT